MSATLEIRLGGTALGRRITPDQLDYSDLRPLLDTIVSAAEIEAHTDTVRPAKSGRPKDALRPLNVRQLALTSIRGGDGGAFDAVYVFVVSAATAPAVGKITAGLAGIGGNALVPEAAEAVRAGLNRAIARGLSVQLVNGVETPTFSAGNPPPDLFVLPTRRMEGQIAARLLRVGGSGKKPLARVKLLGSGQEATLQLGSQKTARELGQHLYRNAVLSGTGEWVIDPARFSAPTRLLSFTVTDYRLLQAVPMDTIIDEMTAATAGALDHVDPTNLDAADE